MPYKDPEVRRAYQREYQAKWYAGNREKHIASARKSRRARDAKVRARINVLKSAPCMDCGSTFDPVCMDFDHRDASTKVDGVSRLAKSKRVAWIKVEEEIAKCDLVCACCHRLRTKARLNAE